MILEEIYRQNGCMHGIFEFHFFIVSLLEESLCVHHVLANCTGLPGPVGAGRIDLIQSRATHFIVTDDQQRHAKWANATEYRS